MTATCKLVLVLSIAVAGCKGAPNCEEALAKAAQVAPALAGPKYMALVVGECIRDKWSDEVRSCFANIKAENDKLACQEKAAFDDYMAESKKESKSTEADEQLHAIGRNQKRTYGETSSFTVGNGAFLPTGVSARTGCCGGKGGTESAPGTAVNNKCTPTPAAFKADPQWSAMGFADDEESTYGYSFVGTSATSFTAYAIGDADCDGNPATFTLQGTIDAAGNPLVNVIKPAAGVF
jgi:hypothetical protein